MVIQRCRSSTVRASIRTPHASGFVNDVVSLIHGLEEWNELMLGGRVGEAPEFPCHVQPLVSLVLNFLASTNNTFFNLHYSY